MDKKYIDYDKDTGKIEAIFTLNGGVLFSLEEFNPPEDFNELQYTHYKYINGRLIKLTESERDNLYFDGVNPEAQAQVKEETERQQKLLDSMFEEIFLNTLSDDQAVQVPLLYPAWESNKDYKEGDRIRYGDFLYKCLRNHTSTQTITPNVNDTIASYAEEINENTYEPGLSTAWAKLG